MSEQKVTLNEARETINHLVQGVDPYTGEVFGEITWMQNPRMIRCFALLSTLLTKCIEKAEKPSTHHRQKFAITKEQADRIHFPQGEIGVKGIVTGVNQVVDIESSSGLTIMSLYKVLKELGILEKSVDEGKGRTVTTDRSAKYGIKTVKNTFQGEEYDRIIYTDTAKEYIRKNLPIWFSGGMEVKS